MTNTMLLLIMVVLVPVFLAALTLIVACLVTLVQELREDRRYLPRHAETAEWLALLPPPRTIWDRPHPGYDVSALTEGEVLAAVLLRVIERIELLERVPHLQPSWIARAMREAEREAGISGRVGSVAGSERPILRAAGAHEPGRGAAGRPWPQAVAAGDRDRSAASRPELLAAGTGRAG